MKCGSVPSEFWENLLDVSRLDLGILLLCNIHQNVAVDRCLGELKT